MRSIAYSRAKSAETWPVRDAVEVERCTHSGGGEMHGRLKPQRATSSSQLSSCNPAESYSQGWEGSDSF